MIAALRSVVRELVALEGLFVALGAELMGIELSGPRARQATITALAVGVSVALALVCQLDMPWWAGVSGFVSVQATRPGSIQRASLRISGTLAGAAMALAVTPWIFHDRIASSLFLFASTVVGMTGSLVSRHGYAWLFFSITANLVVLLSMDHPGLTLHFAVYRAAEVTIGSLAALLVVTILAPATPVARAPTAPGWSDLLDARWPAVLHGIRTGVAVLLVPWTWSWFDLPGLPQMAASARGGDGDAGAEQSSAAGRTADRWARGAAGAWLCRRRYRGARGARCLARRVPALDPRASGRPLDRRVRADEQARHRLYRHPGIGRPDHHDRAGRGAARQHPAPSIGSPGSWRASPFCSLSRCCCGPSRRKRSRQRDTLPPLVVSLATPMTPSQMPVTPRWSSRKPAVFQCRLTDDPG